MNKELTKMVMKYEFITPEMAEVWLESNQGNRKISENTVIAYANDILAGNWDESVGSAICIDENGILRDGQHRLSAIVHAGVGIHTWVCRNVSADGIYDQNRKRSNADQIMIARPDFEGVYKQPRYISVARMLIGRGSQRPVTPSEIIDFTEDHKEELDGFFLNVPNNSEPKISLATVFISMYMAYASGVSIEDLLAYYDILCTGMSTNPKEFPIIAYRNYLKDSVVKPTIQEIARCQYSIKKYLTGSCTKRSIAPKDLIYQFPYGS